MAASPLTPERTVFQIGATRKVVLSFLLLLALPFYVSLGPMLLARFQHGMPIGTWGLLAIALAFTVIMGLLLFQLLFAVRARVELGERGFRVNLPVGRGLAPMLRFAERELRYDQVQAVEVRREIYGAPLAPVLLQGARVLPKSGPPIVLGYVNEKSIDPNLPFTEIAAAIAARAHIQVTDRGSVVRSLPRKLAGLGHGEQPAETMPESEIAVLGRRHDRWMLALIAVFGALLLLGMVGDWTREAGWSPGTSSTGQPTPAEPTRKDPGRK